MRELPGRRHARAAPARRARARLHGALDPSEPQIASVTLALDPEAAGAWLAGCPGLVPHTTFRVGRDGPSLSLLARPTFEALSRALAADVVRSVAIDFDPPMYPN